jgi:hypothetical protein
MRSIADRSGRVWDVTEVAYYGIGEPRATEATIAWVHFMSDGDTLKLEALRDLVKTMSDDDLVQTVDCLLARDLVAKHQTPMREFRDSEDTAWLVTEEGLPGPRRGVRGGLALRFISPKGTRYLFPIPPFWRQIADDHLHDYLFAAKPLIKGS